MLLLSGQSLRTLQILIDPDDYLMLYPIVSAGVRSKLLQRAYHLERETKKDNAIAECLSDQIEYGKWLLQELDKTGKVSSSPKPIRRVTDENIPPSPS